MCGEGQRRHTDRYFRGGSCYQRCIADALILDRSCRPIPPSPCYLVRRVVTYIHWNERRFALLSLSERRTPSVNIYSYREGKDTHTRFKLNKRCGPKSKFMFAEGKTKAPITSSGLRDGAGQSVTAELFAIAHSQMTCARRATVSIISPGTTPYLGLLGKS